MAAGAAIILKRLYDDGRVHGAIAMGGGGGTTLGSIAMQPLPIGAPKPSSRRSPPATPAPSGSRTSP